MFIWVDVCSTQPLCRGIQLAFRRVTHQCPRRRRRQTTMGSTKSLLDHFGTASVTVTNFQSNIWIVLTTTLKPPIGASKLNSRWTIQRCGSL